MGMSVAKQLRVATSALPETTASWSASRVRSRPVALCVRRSCSSLVDPLHYATILRWERPDRPEGVASNMSDLKTERCTNASCR